MTAGAVKEIVIAHQCADGVPCAPCAAKAAAAVTSAVVHSLTRGLAREEKFQGRPFRVVPAVLVRSQVLNNNLGVTLLPADELTDEWAAQWNGIPVLIGDHPALHGQAISGRAPDLWNARAVGWIFNAKIEQESANVRRLVGEVWLDEARAGAVDGFQAVLNAVRDGKPVELSTGFSTSVETSAGHFNGDAYAMVMRPAHPDHLVISTEMTGACSIEDGCGLGVHFNPKAALMEPKVSGFAAIMQRVSELFTRKPTALTDDERRALHIARELEATNLMSDADKTAALTGALQTKFGTGEANVIMCETFADQKQAVFWYQTPLGAFPKGSEYFRTTWTENADGTYEFSDPERVKKVSSYEPVASGSEYGQQTASTAEVAAAANASTPEKGEETIMVDEKEKDNMAALAATVTNLATTVNDLAGKVEALSKQSAPAEIAGLKKTIAGLTEKFDSMHGTMEAAINERERERQSLVEELAGHFRVPFTADELEAKPISELRKLRDMAKGENYAGKGGPRNAINSEQRFVAPKAYWEKDEKSADKGK